MKEFLLPHLICPACLPREEPLDLRSAKAKGSDIVSGDLVCRRCGRTFPVRDGIAILLPDGDATLRRQLRYSDPETVNRYLWSHYADLAGDPEADTPGAWGELLEKSGGAALDAGCAVGRHLFEAAARRNWGVGCDLSPEFIRTARQILQERRGTISLPLEGNLRERFSFELPAEWGGDNLEFVVADALALPFARESFAVVSSLNLLDRVAHPLAHLYEMNRVARTTSARFLCADPFSWTTDASPEERWLGGTATGPYAGRGLDNVRSLLTGRDRVLAPPWNIRREGSLSWALRTHRNHRELIRSQYLLAER